MFNRILLISFSIIIISSIKTFSQEKEPVLNGTEGEILEANKPDSSKQSKYSNWNKFDGPLTTLQLSGGFLYEYAGYSQDAESKEQLDLEPDFKVRDCRFAAGGKFKFNREITWKAGFMYDGTSGTWFMRETGVMIKLPEISGHLFIGRTKEGYSLSKVMNGYSLWNLERSMSIDIIPILADGFKYLGYFPKQRLVMNIGYYNDWLSYKQSFSTYKSQFVSRIGFLPIYEDATKPVLHVGVNFRYGQSEHGTLQVRSRPEANPAPYFIDTKTFTVKSSTHFGGELYYRSGSLLAGGEFNVHKMNSAESGNASFAGGEVFVSYMFTGEIRPYLTTGGIFTFIKVKRPVTRGGPGAWEVILRYSSLDLTDGNIKGGEFWRFTPTVDWYLSDNFRMVFAYGYGVLNRFEKEGATQFFQTRAMVIF